MNTTLVFSFALLAALVAGPVDAREAPASSYAYDYNQYMKNNPRQAKCLRTQPFFNYPSYYGWTYRTAHCQGASESYSTTIISTPSDTRTALERCRSAMTSRLHAAVGDGAKYKGNLVIEGWLVGVGPDLTLKSRRGFTTTYKCSSNALYSVDVWVL